MRTRDMLPILLIVLLFSFSFYAYAKLPDQIPIHWNAKGDVNGTGGRWTVFLIPIITLIGYLVIIFLPKYDVYKKNLEKCSTPIYWLAVLMILFFAVLHMATTLQALGSQFNINYVLVPSFGIFLIGLGLILPHIKRNFFIGIRSPWTLSSEKVWDRTHKVGGTVFIIIGILTLISIIIINYALMIMLVALLIGAIGLIIYSYRIFKKSK